MNKHLRFTNQKTMVAALVAIGLTTTLTAVSFVPRTANGAFDFQALSDQVQQQQNQLNNHEARINNNEKDINALQQNTGTEPASDRAAVPAQTSTTTTDTQSGGSTSPAPSTQPTTAPAPAPAPITEINRVFDANNGVCVNNVRHYGYTSYLSDGSSDHVTQPDQACASPRP